MLLRPLPFPIWKNPHNELLCGSRHIANKDSLRHQLVIIEFQAWNLRKILTEEVNLLSTFWRR